MRVTDHERILSAFTERLPMIRISSDTIAGGFKECVKAVCQFPESKVEDFISVQVMRSEAILGHQDRSELDVAIDMGCLGLQEVLAAPARPNRRTARLLVPEPGVRTSSGWTMEYFTESGE